MKKILFVSFLLFPMYLNAAVVAGFFDINGKPLHTQDEFTLNVTAQVSKVNQGFQYNYTLQSAPTSVQPVKSFALIIRKDTVVQNTSTAPLPNSNWIKAEPQSFTNDARIAWVFRSSAGSQGFLQPSQQISGFSFISPYPPGIVTAYATGVNGYPAADPNWPDTPQGLPEYDGLTPYGPGKIIPVIGPVKPVTPNVTNNYSVMGCVGGICDVQLDITGPMDPNGTAYTYNWTGAFGSATGAKPVVQLAAGNYQVSVSVSDPYATLVTATMPIIVVGPNPPAGGGTGNGGNAGGAGNGGGAGQGAGGQNGGGGAGNGGNTGGGQGAGGTTGGGGTGQGNGGSGQGSGGAGGDNTNHPPSDHDDENSDDKDKDHHDSEDLNDKSDD